jgi:hypothetical protein
MSMRSEAGLLAILFVALALVLATACGSRVGGCSSGTCACPSGDDCRFVCTAPPCHVTCEGDNGSCQAVCANGTCTCGSGSSCAFACKAPPCHVTCEPNSSCSGTCANGQCVCGAGSTCSFTCSASPCHTSCAAGAAHCPAALAGTEGCDIVDCAAGTPVICPSGDVITCGAPCP